MPTPTKPLLETSSGKLRYNFHKGQARAWRSTARIVAVIAGAQGGKTAFGPAWLLREIERRGSGDYLIVTPTFTLLDKAVLPTFLHLFKTLLGLGDYHAQSKAFIFSDTASKRLFGAAYDPQKPTRVLFGYADNPDSLESMTVKAAWLDEAGQKRFRLGAWEAIQRRVAIHQGRVLITTTPYEVAGWLKARVYDVWKRGDPTVEVIRFDSTENPSFPKAEFERARATMPRWKFDLFYRGILTRPAGLIFDSFDEALHKVPRFTIPDEWPRFLGLDFGGVNTSGVFFAREPGTNRLFAYREYLEGGRTAKEHVQAMLAGEIGIPTCVGGSHSEGQWRAEFKAAGLPVREPDQKLVEVGIDRTYGAIKTNQLYVFDDLSGTLDELLSYSRTLDDAGNPTEEIEDKSSYHRLDAIRYIVGWLLRPDQKARTVQLPW